MSLVIYKKAAVILFNFEKANDLKIVKLIAGLLSIKRGKQRRDFRQTASDSSS